MTYEFGLHFTQELGNRFGSATDSWPATAERVTPILAIIVDALGTEGSERWFAAARRAHLSVIEADETRAYKLRLCPLPGPGDEAQRGLTLPVVAAFEAMEGLVRGHADGTAPRTLTCTSSAHCGRTSTSAAPRASVRVAAAATVELCREQAASAARRGWPCYPCSTLRRAVRCCAAFGTGLDP